MPKESSSTVLKRQWTIIQFLLLQSQYVSTAEIEEYLYQQGVETPLRTIQRDLNLLETLFPLECRRDCMPYNWRWKRIETSIKGLNIPQALILRLVSEELRDVLPEHILTELNPLFEKAKLITSNAAMRQKEKSIMDIFNSEGGLGAVQPSIIGQLITGISDKVNEVYRDTFNLDQKETQPVLERLAVFLESHELPELAQALKS